MATQSGRGGKREPLPRFTLTIPNYRKHNPEIEGRRHWVRFDRTTPQDVRLCRCSLEARGVFCLLVMASDEGVIADVTYRDLGRLLNARPQTLASVILQLENAGLIQTDLKRESNASQTQSKRESNASQTKPFEQSANGAVLSAPTETTETTESTQKKGAESGRAGEDTDEGGPEICDKPAPTVTAAEVIAQALADHCMPYRGLDPAIGYRADALGFVTRKPGDLAEATWADWVCRAIGESDPATYPIAVNEALKASRLANAYIPPRRPARGRRQPTAADQAHIAEWADKWETIDAAQRREVSGDN